MSDINKAYRELLDVGNYIVLNKTLVHALGLFEAIYLGALIDRENFAISKKLLNKIGFFKCKQASISGRVILSTYQQSECLKTLKRHKLVEVVKKGVPPTNHYRIDYSAIINFISQYKAKNAQSPNSQGIKALTHKASKPEPIGQHIYKEKNNIKKNDINTTPAIAGAETLKNKTISMSSIEGQKSSEEGNLPRGLTKSEKVVYQTYKKCVRINCNEKTKTILAGIPRAIKTFELYFEQHDEALGNLIAAIEAYTSDTWFKDRMNENPIIFAPKTFFSQTFIDNNLVPLISNNQNEHGTDGEDRYSEEELREISEANKERRRAIKERRAKRGDDSSGV